MTPKPIHLLCLLACVSLPGCTLCQNVKRTILSEPSDFSWMADRKLSEEVYRSWADLAWREQYSTDPEQCNSNAYVVGFKDGFTDYVFAGGSGEPPPVPPRLFWNVDVRNPNGRSEATDWFAGFRHGSQVAREEGHRERALVPSSLFLFGSREDRWENEPSYSGPSSAPMAVPLQPEFVPPGQLQTEAIPEFPEPELPKLEAPAADRPSVEVPAVEVPAIEVPAVEKLPQPQLVPEENPIPQQPAVPQQHGPIERPPEDVRPPSDVDDIFGSTTRNLRAHEPQTLRIASFENVTHRDVAVQQTRSAFAAALRSRSKAAERSSTGRFANARLDAKVGQHQRVKTSVGTVTMHMKNGTSTIPAPRPAAIPKSEDKSREMFRRLTH